MPIPDRVRAFLIGDDVPPAMSEDDVKTIVTGMFSDQTPAPVSTNGETGQADALPRADHTHATSVQRAILKTDAKGVVTWTFARPYQTGQVPTCSATAECALPTVGTAPIFFVANLVAGSVTNTQCQFQVVRYTTQTLSSVLASLLGAVVNVFGVAPAGVTIHCTAALPTQ